MAPLDTPRLHELVTRIQSGDQDARNELVRTILDRLEKLARRMIRNFPGVRRQEETSDVLQQALLRLMRALEAIQPTSTRDFFNLAAVQVRRTLIDLARHYQHAPPVEKPDNSSASEKTRQIPSPEAEPDHLDSWAAFHEAVTQLPAEQREIVSLTFYHGWTQAYIAELLEVDVRTVRRHWQAACLRLKEMVGDLPPG